MKIGFIGLGIMGKPMAKNLLKAGHRLVVANRSYAALKELECAGAETAENAAAVAKQCKTIITMLPNSPDVEQVICGVNGILQSAESEAIIIDMSSIAPKASQEMAKACIAKGVHLLDAPVSGGEPKAIEGSLAIMVGGEQDIFEKVKDAILLKMGASATYCGKSGAGNTTKLANQVVVACNIAACAEAFTLAKKTAVEPQLVLDAIKGGLAGSAVMAAKVPMMIADDFPPGFKTDLHIKDLSNALATAHEVGAPLPLTAAVMEMMQTLHADGWGNSDHSAIAKYYAKISGVKIGEIDSC